MLEIIQSFEKAIEVFRDGENKHDYELLKFPRFKQIYIDMFSEMHTKFLKELVQLPDPYFKELLEDELEARKTKARLLRTHGRLHRREGQVCLNLIVLEDSDENRALLDPNFRELLTMVVTIRKETGIDLLDYDSFEVFSKVLLSSMDTKVLKCIKHILDSSGTPDEVLDAVLESRMTDANILAQSI